MDNIIPFPQPQNKAAPKLKDYYDEISFNPKGDLKFLAAFHKLIEGIKAESEIHVYTIPYMDVRMQRNIDAGVDKVYPGKIVNFIENREKECNTSFFQYDIIDDSFRGKPFNGDFSELNLWTIIAAMLKKEIDGKTHTFIDFYGFFGDGHSLQKREWSSLDAVVSWLDDNESEYELLEINFEKLQDALGDEIVRREALSRTLT